MWKDCYLKKNSQEILMPDEVWSVYLSLMRFLISHNTEVIYKTKLIFL